MPKAADELFDDFIFNFAANRKLQFSRIVFPLKKTDGKKVSYIEKKQWKMEHFFMPQGYYTLIFDNMKQMKLVKDTSINNVVVEKVYLDRKKVKKYIFERINGQWMLTGINTNASPEDYPEEVRDLAVSVADAATEPFTRVELLCDILKNMEDLYETAVQDGFGPVFDEWRRYSCTLGQEVKVIAPDMTYFGTAEDIDEEGLLIVRREDGSKEKVVAGDVSIRPAKAKGNEYA